ncbi:MAG: DUF1295 domain-containing protein [Gammaproteobacteria bacterium]|nr:DUF1295 domain-containing protein [Gammaproteobacteria bacterium]
MPEPNFISMLTELTSLNLLEAAGMVLVFVGVLFWGSVVVPGRRIKGPDTEGNTREYKLNGLALFLMTAFVIALVQSMGWFSLSVLYSQFAALFVAANVFAFLLATWLFFQATRIRETTTGFWRGYFVGVLSNPTWLGVDIKLFSYRPSLIGLALINASFAVTQYEIYGELTLAMMLYQIFTFLYVFNYFQFEQGMVHTWDMISERFGWMLIWGDYVLVPFFYCLVGWWLVHPSDVLHPVAAAAIVLLFGFGFWLFRGANQQKHRFKRNADTRIWGQPARTLEGRLLIYGFLVIGRHLNYTGEICVYFSFALTTGFESWVPYLLPAWLTVLLCHRSLRDEQRCRAKYGDLWTRYKQRVRYSMLPFVY